MDQDLAEKWQRHCNLKKQRAVNSDLWRRSMERGCSPYNRYSSANKRIREELDDIKFSDKEMDTIRAYNEAFDTSMKEAREYLGMQSPWPWHLERWANETGNKVPVSLLILFT
jgi:hypothetical protein